MTWAAAGIGALIGGGTALATGGNVLEGVALGGATGGAGSMISGAGAGAGATNGLLAESASLTPSAATEVARASAAPIIEQGGTTAGINTGFASMPNLPTAIDPFGPEAALQGVQGMPNAISPFEASQLGQGIPGSGMTQASMEEGLLKALPDEKPGFQQKLTTGLLDNAGAFMPQQDDTPPPASGPRLQASPLKGPENLYAKFNRGRR